MKKTTAAKKTAEGLKPKNLVVKSSGTALSVLNKLVLTDKAPLYALVAVTFESTEAELKNELKTIGAELKFWKALTKEATADKKKKALLKGAKVFTDAQTAFAKVVTAQAKLVKAKKAKSGKKDFEAAALKYNGAMLKGTESVLKAMSSYETAANKLILKGYTKEVKKQTKTQKLNEKKAKGGNTVMIVLGSLFGVGVLAFAVYWFKFRKTE